MEGNITSMKNYSWGEITLQPAANVTEFWNLAQTVCFGIWLTLSMLFATFGNVMVILVVIRHRGMRTRTNMFLVNLAVADFLVGTLMAPFSLTTLIREEWIFGKVWCQINGFLNTLCFVTSIHTLMYISIHKLVSIVWPFSRFLNKWRILIMMAAAWTWSAVCGVLTVSGLSVVLHKNGTTQCGPEYPHNPSEYLHHIIIQVTNIFLPLTIMIGAYIKIFWEIRNHMVRMRENSALHRDTVIAQQKSVTITLFIVLACFVICWIPYHIYSMYVTLEKDKSSIATWTNPAAYCFAYMNSACNPIIYAWRSPAFREGYKEILCQDPSYVVSDEGDLIYCNLLQDSLLKKDAFRGEDSPSALRRLSLFLAASVKGTSRRESEETAAKSMARSRSSSCTSTSAVTSHSLMKKSMSKIAKGSSIIRRDDSVIIMKDGKIVSFRQNSSAKLNSGGKTSPRYNRSPDKELTDGENSPTDICNHGNPEDLQSSVSNGLRKPYPHRGSVTLETLPETPPTQRADNSSDARKISDVGISVNNFSKHLNGKQIPSPDETPLYDTEVCYNGTDINLNKFKGGDKDTDLKKDPKSTEGRLEINKSDMPKEMTPEAAVKPSQTETEIQINGISIACNSTEPEESRDFTNKEQPNQALEFNSFEKTNPCVTGEASHSLSPAKQERLSKSDLYLNSSSTENKTSLTLAKDRGLIFRVPLLRGPSQEHLDIPRSGRMKRSASDVQVNKPSTPQYTRRWNSPVGKASKGESFC